MNIFFEIMDAYPEAARVPDLKNMLPLHWSSLHFHVLLSPLLSVLLLDTCTHTYTHTHIHTYTHTYTHMDIQSYPHTDTHKSARTRMRMRTCPRRCARAAFCLEAVSCRCELGGATSFEQKGVQWGILRCAQACSGLQCRP